MMTNEIKTLDGWGAQNGDKFKLEEVGVFFSPAQKKHILEVWEGRVGVCDGHFLEADGLPGCKLYGGGGHLFSLVSRAGYPEIKTLKEWNPQNGDRFRLEGLKPDIPLDSRIRVTDETVGASGAFHNDFFYAEPGPTFGGPTFKVHKDSVRDLFSLVSRADAKPETPPHKRWRDMPVEEQLEIALHKLYGGDVQYSLTATDPKWKITSFNGPQHDVFYRKKPKPPTKMQILADKVAEALGGIGMEDGKRVANALALILAEDET